MKIFITQFDYDRLVRLLDKRKPHDAYDKALIVELEKAEIVDSQDVPHDVITMNSQVRFVDEHGERQDFWLVFPEDADVQNQKISILSPLGCAVIGYRKGDTIDVPTPKGPRKLTVQEIIHQPEREGDFAT